MYKQEDFTITNIEMESYMLNSSPEYHDINAINMNDIIPLATPINSGNMQLILASQQLEEATMDVATKFEITEFPISPRGPPARDVFEGELDFQVEINASDTHKRKYLYSNRLNRIYVDMRQSFPVSFRWRGGAALYVRATCVFADQSQAEKRVERCTQHTHESTNNPISPEIVGNVLHSSREIGTHGVYYCGRADQLDYWYSVLVELPHCTSSSPTVTHAYQFVCKNSCSSGINRRAIDVIFTLEDASGRVYGRQTVGARVCACPRRDLNRDEEAEGLPRGKKRLRPNAHNAPNAPVDAKKKIKLEVDGNDDGLHTLPSLQIVGLRPMITGLEVMLSMLEQTAFFKKNDPQALEKYNKSISDLRSKIEELKRN